MSLFHTLLLFFFFFFFNDTATTEIYTLSLHDALPCAAAELEFAHLAQPELPRPAPGYPHRARCRRRGALEAPGALTHAAFALGSRRRGSALPGPGRGIGRRALVRDQYLGLQSRAA